ncbi:MAG TPA: hypothetical protein VNE41_01945 [Chitinophagaceae bacterium]|nr:hypothetical protein [Chitinophagaceae bacterium]
MKIKSRSVALILISLMCLTRQALAQCSICTKTAQQLGPQAAHGLNAGILYLMAMPFAIASFVAYRFWKGGAKH